jgi:hypothetical protein
VNGGISAETMTAPGGIAHLARRRPAVMMCGARTAVVDGSLGSEWQSAAAGNGEVRRSRGRGACAVVWAAALRSDRGRCPLRHGGASDTGPVGMGRLYGAGVTAVPPRVANPGAVHGSLAADKWTPHVSAFPFSKILKNSFSHKKNGCKVSKI